MPTQDKLCSSSHGLESSGAKYLAQMMAIGRHGDLTSLPPECRRLVARLLMSRGARKSRLRTQSNSSVTDGEWRPVRVPVSSRHGQEGWHTVRLSPADDHTYKPCRRRRSNSEESAGGVGSSANRFTRINPLTRIFQQEVQPNSEAAEGQSAAEPTAGK